MTRDILLETTIGRASFLRPIADYPWLFVLFLFIGLAVGVIWGLLYFRFKARFFSAQANDRIESIINEFQQEKDTSETILRELQVGVLAYGSDGRLVIGNPSANKLLDSRDMPKSIQSFLDRYGKDNGISLELMLQTTGNITGNINVKDRIVRIRMTRAQLSSDMKQGWIIIIQDITEQEREEKQRKEFVANVSHELKTPLTTISAYSETLLEWGLEGKTKYDIRSDISRIHDDCERMDNLVQNLLLLSSIDSRGIRPKMIQYDMSMIIRQVVSRLQLQAEDKKIKYELSFLSFIPPVFGDPTAMDRILTNLVSNAIKYTGVGGFVKVSAHLTDNYISIKVTDNGMGVTEENLPRLFDRFYRVDSTGSRKYGGTGLGLSIAKELTELQGGRIFVNSVFGKGTEFMVTIPKAETTYKEAIAAVQAGSPRTEVIYENAAQYILTAAGEIDIQSYRFEDLNQKQLEKILRYLLLDPDDPYFIEQKQSAARQEQVRETPPVLPQEKDAPLPPPESPPAQKVQMSSDEPVIHSQQKAAPRVSTENNQRSQPQSYVKSNSTSQHTSQQSQEQLIEEIPQKQYTAIVKPKVEDNPAKVPVSKIPASKAVEEKKVISPAERLTRSKIHPDNRLRTQVSLDVGSQSKTDETNNAGRETMTIEDLQKEMREK